MLLYNFSLIIFFCIYYIYYMFFSNKYYYQGTGNPDGQMQGLSGGERGRPDGVAGGGQGNLHHALLHRPHQQHQAPHHPQEDGGGLQPVHPGLLQSRPGGRKEGS